MKLEFGAEPNVTPTGTVKSDWETVEGLKFRSQQSHMAQMQLYYPT